MAKWSGKVFFPTSGQASRAMAYGRYPALPFDRWKPRPERQRIPADKLRLDGVLVMLEYGLRVMSDARLSSLGRVLQDELDRNEQRWVPRAVQPVQRGIEQIGQEQRRRQALLNPVERLRNWFSAPKSNSSWTQEDAESLWSDWKELMAEEAPS